MRNPIAGQSRSEKVFVDPVVVGLGRLLIWVGVLSLAAVLSVGWFLLRSAT